MQADGWLYSVTIAMVAAGVAGLLVPLYIVQLGGGALQLGISAAVASVAGAPGAILAGRHADRTGDRRTVVIAALLASSLGLAVLPLVRTVWLVIAVYAVVALSVAALGPVLTMLVVNDRPASSWSRHIARLNRFQGYGTTLGFLLGTGWLVVVGPAASTVRSQRILFAIAAALGIVAAILAAKWLPSAVPPPVGRRRARTIATLLGRTTRDVRPATFSYGFARLFWGLRSLPQRSLQALAADLPRPLLLYFVAAFVFFTGFGAFWAPLPLFLTDVNLSSGGIFGVYLLNNVGSTLLFGRAGQYCDSYDVRLLQTGALSLRACCFLVVGLLGGTLGVNAIGLSLGTLPVIAAVLAIIGVSWAFIAVSGTVIVSRTAPAQSRGGILGTYAALAAVAGATGNVLGGLLAQWAFEAAFLLSVVFVAIGGGVVALTRWFSTAQPESTV